MTLLHLVMPAAQYADDQVECEICGGSFRAGSIKMASSKFNYDVGIRDHGYIRCKPASLTEWSKKEKATYCGFKSVEDWEKALE